MKSNRFLNSTWKRWSVFSFIVIAGIAGSLFLPWNVGVLTSHPHPAQSYAEAVHPKVMLKQYIEGKFII